MQTLRNTLPPGRPERKLPARDPSRGLADDAARRDLTDAPGREIKLGPVRIPSGFAAPVRD